MQFLSLSLSFFFLKNFVVLNKDLIININSKKACAIGIQTSTCGPHYAVRGHIYKLST